MRKLISVCISLLIVALVSSCNKEENIDRTPPEIDISTADAFPKPCSELNRGQTFIIKAQLSDNVELGSVGVDIHHNFDHHNHTTEEKSCSLSDKQAPSDKVFKFNKSISIAGLKFHKTAIEVPIPADSDPGEYHLTITVTDKAGWLTPKTLGIKLM